jgi:hypothetical protein
MFQNPGIKARRVLNRIIQAYWNARFDATGAATMAASAQERQYDLHPAATE